MPLYRQFEMAELRGALGPVVGAAIPTAGLWCCERGRSPADDNDGGGAVNSKKLLVFIVFMAVVFLVMVPYVRFVIQRQRLDTDLARISLDYSTMGRARFEERVEQICRKAGLEPGRYSVAISEDANARRVWVVIRYEAKFRIFLVPWTEEVVLRNDFSVLDL